MLMARAPPTKKKSRRNGKDLKAAGRTLRGRFASPATIEIYSGPQIVKEAWTIADMIPRNLPVDPGTMCSTKGPGSLQYLKPYLSWIGLAPTCR